MNMRMLVVALVILSAPARGQDDVAPPPPVGGPPAQARERPRVAPEDLARLLAPRADLLPSPAAMAGLPEEGPVVALTLATAYALAEARAATQMSREALADAKALEGLITQGESLPIDRLKARLGAKPEAGDAEPATPDLAASYFDALEALSQAQNAARAVARHEVMLELIREFAKGASSGISQLQIDQVDLQLQHQRASLLTDQTRYRDALDALKRAIGLPPSAPIVIDPATLAGFDAFARALGAWQADPDHDAFGLDALFPMLPELPEVRVGEASLEALDDEAAIGSALAGTPVAGDEAAEFRARAAIRALARLRNQYQLDRSRLLILGRQRDETLQRLIAPPEAGRQPPSRNAVMTLNLLTSDAGVGGAQEQLAQDWCQFQEQRLALQRLLGTFPYDSWDAFRAAYTATPTAAPSE